jgi:hypothetical protein
MTAISLVESATFLRSWHSKLDVGYGESRRPAVQRELTATNTRLREVYWLRRTRIEPLGR